jgi:hypothetical protein
MLWLESRQSVPISILVLAPFLCILSDQTAAVKRLDLFLTTKKKLGYTLHLIGTSKNVMMNAEYFYSIIVFVVSTKTFYDSVHFGGFWRNRRNLDQISFFVDFVENRIEHYIYFLPANIASDTFETYMYAPLL